MNKHLQRAICAGTNGTDVGQRQLAGEDDPFDTERPVLCKQVGDVDGDPLTLDVEVGVVVDDRDRQRIRQPGEGVAAEPGLPDIWAWPST